MQLIDLSNIFPKAQWYNSLCVPRSSMVCEKASNKTFPYSERHLQCAWYDSLWKPGVLRTNSGEEVFVKHPGRWNLEAGPDFLDAVFVVGPARRTIKGDVEIHIHPRDWLAHGHLGDPGYKSVIAHVTYFPGILPSESLPTGTLQISMCDVLRMNHSFSFDVIDVSAYPYAVLQKEKTPCSEILSEWSPERRVELLEAAGHERLRIKTERVKELLKTTDEHQVLYEEIMCALGYKNNSSSFRKLAKMVTLEDIKEEADGDVLKAYALLLGVAGLLPSKTSSRWDEETHKFVRSLWDTWWKLRSKWESRILPIGSWVLSGMRPQNHPRRRLAAAAKLSAIFDEFSDKLIELPISEPASWFREAENIIKSNSNMDYWTYRLGLSGEKRLSETSLIGSSRIASILSNIIIPFLAAYGKNITPLLDSAPAEVDNSHIRSTAFNLFGRDHNPDSYKKSILQQGLLQICHDYCFNKAECENCQLCKALLNQSPA